MKTKKLIVIALLTAITSLGLSAQNTWREKGYRFDVSLSYTLSNQWEAATSHGYGFGNGLFLGGGAAFHYDAAAKMTQDMEDNNKTCVSGLQKIEKAAVDGYKAIENGVVNGYKAIEKSTVDGYMKIQNGAVNGWEKLENRILEIFKK